MTPNLADYVEAGYALTPDERLEAARMLRLSVDQDAETSRGQVEAEWDAVIQRRVADLVGGRVQPVDGEESFSRILARLDALHK